MIQNKEDPWESNSDIRINWNVWISITEYSEYKLYSELAESSYIFVQMA